jgi:hypothetical protein
MAGSGLLFFLYLSIFFQFDAFKPLKKKGVKQKQKQKQKQFGHLFSLA